MPVGMRIYVSTALVTQTWLKVMDTTHNALTVLCWRREAEDSDEKTLESGC